MKTTAIATVIILASELALVSCSSTLPPDVKAGLKENKPEAYGRAGYFYQMKNGGEDQKQWAKAVEMYRKGAELGNAACQSKLGYAYQAGMGVTRDYGQALAWLNKSAAQNNASAFFHLAMAYSEGYGVPVNYSQAIKYFERSASLGAEEAYGCLGLMYEKGEGVKMDKKKALNYYMLGAKAGNTTCAHEYQRLSDSLTELAPDYIGNKVLTIYYYKGQCRERYEGGPWKNIPYPEQQPTSVIDFNKCKMGLPTENAAGYTYVTTSPKTAKIFLDYTEYSKDYTLHFTSATEGNVSGSEGGEGEEIEFTNAAFTLK